MHVHTLAYILVKWLWRMVCGTLAITTGPSAYEKVREKTAAFLEHRAFITESIDLLKIDTSVSFAFFILDFVQVETFVLKLCLTRECSQQ